jgi:hypothetical protein
MVSMLTVAAVPVPPIDGTIEEPARSQHMCESTAAKSASSRIHEMDREGSHLNDSPWRLSGASQSRKNLPCEKGTWTIDSEESGKPWLRLEQKSEKVTELRTWCKDSGAPETSRKEV